MKSATGEKYFGLVLLIHITIITLRYYSAVAGIEIYLSMSG